MYKFIRFLAISTFILATSIINGCGNAGISSSDSSNLSMNLGVGDGGNTAGTVAVDQVTTCVAKISPLTTSTTPSTPFNNLEITFQSSNENVIPTVKARTNAIGAATAYIRPNNTITTKTNVTITAVVGGVRSNTVLVTVIPASLTIAVGTTESFTVDGATPAGTPVRIVNQGATLTMLSPSGQPVANQMVEITVKSITNRRITATNSDLIVFQPVDGIPSVESPPGTVTLVTNSAGIINLPFYAVVLASGVAGGQHVITVNFEAKTTYNSQVFVATASSQYTLKQ